MRAIRFVALGGIALGGLAASTGEWALVIEMSRYFVVEYRGRIGIAPKTLE